MEYALLVKEVSKDFGKSTVLKDISFSVPEGEIYGIIGMSGSGKTTILHHLVGFLEPDGGQILYKQGDSYEPIRSNMLAVRQLFGYSPQKPSFYPQLTLEENLTYFGGLYHLKKDVIVRNIDRLLGLTKLSGHKKKLAQELSGGMQRRLSLACSMMHSPRVLILDEPTADLDPILRDEMWQLIQNINQLGSTIIVASHFLEELEQVSHSIAILHEGKILRTGGVRELCQEFSKGTQEITITAKSVVEAKRILTLFKQQKSPTRINGRKVTIYAKQPLRLLTRLLQASAHGKINAEAFYLHNPSLREVFTNLAKGGSR